MPFVVDLDFDFPLLTCAKLTLHAIVFFLTRTRYTCFAYHHYSVSDTLLYLVGFDRRTDGDGGGTGCGEAVSEEKGDYRIVTDNWITHPCR